VTGPDDPRCAWCRRAIPDGEARLRLFAIVYHLGCWDARVAADLPAALP
jgi:hypothetical protein